MHDLPVTTSSYLRPAPTSIAAGRYLQTISRYHISSIIEL